MPPTTLTLDPTFDGRYSSWSGTGIDTEANIYVGNNTGPDVNRSYIRYSLAQLSSSAVLQEARVLVNLNQFFAGSTVTVNLQAYNQDGQADPEADSAANRNTRCANDGTPYLSSVTWNTTGSKTLTLPRAALLDIMQAKAAVNRFSIAINEGSTALGHLARIEAVEDAGSAPVQLVLVYTGIEQGFPSPEWKPTDLSRWQRWVLNRREHRTR